MIDSIYWIWEDTLLNFSMSFENWLGVTIFGSKYFDFGIKIVYVNVFFKYGILISGSFYDEILLAFDMDILFSDGIVWPLMSSMLCIGI